MSSLFPEKVLEILVQEFIGLTNRSKNRDVTPETRAKLGEILVKTTRALGNIMIQSNLLNVLIYKFLQVKSHRSTKVCW